MSSVDGKTLQTLLEDCKRVNCEYKKKHEELKEVIKSYKHLANEAEYFDKLSLNLVNILKLPIPNSLNIIFCLAIEVDCSFIAEYADTK